MNYMSFETITHFLFSQNIGPSAAEDGPEFKRFQPPIWMVGSLDALTPNAVDSLAYLYFLCHCPAKGKFRERWPPCVTNNNAIFYFLNYVKYLIKK